MRIQWLRLICTIAAPLVLLTPLALADDDNLSAEVFGALSAMRAPAISPDGSTLAYFTEVEDGPVMAIRNLSDNSGFRIDTSEVKPRSIQWVGDENVLLIASETNDFHGYRGQYEIYRAFTVDITGRTPIRQIPRAGRHIGVNINLGRVVGVNWDESRILMPARSPDGNYDLLGVDVTSGRSRIVARGAQNTLDWVVDSTGQPVMRFDHDDRRNRMQVRRRIDGEWRVAVSETTEIPSITPYGLTADTEELAVGVRFTSTGVDGIYVLSDSGEFTRTLIEDANYDVGGAIVDPYTNHLIGAHIDTTTPGTLWLDTEMREHQALLERSFPGLFVQIVSWARDRSRLVVRLENGSVPPLYYLFDTTERSASPLGAAYPALLDATLPTREPYSYAARDGVMIPGYLTLPADRDPQNLPFVLLPHGGPEARDIGGFDWLAHFIASRGYVVLQPNFRGSDGLGYKWRDAGGGGWGTGTMQHDLTDGVAALVESGMVDPDRVCIVGASYGGYAALAGATFTPELYACAAAIAPVTNVPAFLTTTREKYGRESSAIASWTRQLGGEENMSRERLRSISPALHAENVQAPILLLHGRDDTVVDISQSNQMERALRRAGADVRLVRLPNEDHGMSTAETRIQMLTELEAFLAEHLD